MHDAERRPFDACITGRLNVRTRVPIRLVMASGPTRAEIDADTAAEHYQKWKQLAPLGLVTVGFGASLIGQSTILKSENASTWKWVALGTVSLAVFNAGLCLFGDAVKHRALYEWSRAE